MMMHGLTNPKIVFAVVHDAYHMSKIELIIVESAVQIVRF